MAMGEVEREGVLFKRQEERKERMERWSFQHPNKAASKAAAAKPPKRPLRASKPSRALDDDVFHLIRV
jgi:hypothetical protein